MNVIYKAGKIGSGLTGSKVSEVPKTTKDRNSASHLHIKEDTL